MQKRSQRWSAPRLLVAPTSLADEPARAPAHGTHTASAPDPSRSAGPTPGYRMSPANIQRQSVPQCRSALSSPILGEGLGMGVASSLEPRLASEPLGLLRILLHQLCLQLLH